MKVIVLFSLSFVETPVYPMCLHDLVRGRHVGSRPKFLLHWGACRSIVQPTTLLCSASAPVRLLHTFSVIFVRCEQCKTTCARSRMLTSIFMHVVIEKIG